MPEVRKRKIQYYGWRPDAPDHRDRLHTPEPTQLPAVVSLRDKMPAVYDQGELGSCTGNAIAGAMEFEEVFQGEQNGPPSRLFIYYGEREIEGTTDQDAGAEIRDGLKVVSKLGVPPETDWPYDISKFAERPSQTAYEHALKHQAIEYARLTPGQQGSPLRTCLANGKPFVFGFSVYESFEGADVAKTGVMPMPNPDESLLGGHAVLCVGYDHSKTRFPEPMFEVRNSWGPDFGDQGYFWMPARFMGSNNTSDFWTISKTS